MQLGLLPRMEIRHTSEAQSGQIYMPRVNTLLLIGVLLLVIHVQVFGRARFGLWLAVTGTHGGDGDSWL